MKPMTPVSEIAVWCVAFVGSHLIVSSRAVRPRLIRAIGDQPYRGVYSLISLGTFIPMTVAFGRHKHAGAMLWYLRNFESARIVVWVAMALALILIAAGIVRPSPSAMVGRAENVPHGMQKITRHPTFAGISLFGLAHMLMNGWVGDLWFFGSFPALGILGGLHQDSRKLGEIGQSYREFKAATSFFPGLAILDGRQRLALADVPWLAIVIGIVLWIVLVIAHPYWFGGSPLG
jgi:uncharacterized membrane protein